MTPVPHLYVWWYPGPIHHLYWTISRFGYTPAPYTIYIELYLGLVIPGPLHHLYWTISRFGDTPAPYTYMSIPLVPCSSSQSRKSKSRDVEETSKIIILYIFAFLLLYILVLSCSFVYSNNEFGIHILNDSKQAFGSLYILNGPSELK